MPLDQWIYCIITIPCSSIFIHFPIGQVGDGRDVTGLALRHHVQVFLCVRTFAADADDAAGGGDEPLIFSISHDC